MQHLLILHFQDTSHFALVLSQHVLLHCGQVFQSLSLSVSDLLHLFSKQPSFFNFSWGGLWIELEFIFDFYGFEALEKRCGHIEFNFAVYFFLSDSIITSL